MKRIAFAAIFAAFTTTAHAADPIGFLDLGDARATTSRPSLFSGFGNEGQRADTAMPEHPAERSMTPSRTPSKPDAPTTPDKPETPTKPDKPGKPDRPDKPGKPDRGDKPGKGKDKDRDHGKGQHGKDRDGKSKGKGGHHGKR